MAMPNRRGRSGYRRAARKPSAPCRWGSGWRSFQAGRREVVWRSVSIIAFTTQAEPVWRWHRTCRTVTRGYIPDNGSFLTRRWRETDSNSPSPANGSPFIAKTGSSNPASSSGESRANLSSLISCRRRSRQASRGHGAQEWSRDETSRPRWMQASGPPGGSLPGYCAKFQRAQ